MRAYTLIDHTADLGIRVLGKTLEDLFINAGYALFDILVGNLPPARTKSRELSVSGIDWPDLMVNWLRALFFLWTDDQSVPSAIRITSLVMFELTAHVEVTQFDARHDKNHP